MQTSQVLINLLNSSNLMKNYLIIKLMMIIVKAILNITLQLLKLHSLKYSKQIMYKNFHSQLRLNQQKAHQKTQLNTSRKIK